LIQVDYQIKLFCLRKYVIYAYVSNDRGGLVCFLTNDKFSGR